MTMETDVVTASPTEVETMPTEQADVVDGGLGDVPAEAEQPANDAGLTDQTEEVKADQPETLGAPEGDYTLDGVELPEGVTIDSEIAMELGNVCRDLNLSQSTYSTIAAKMTPVIAARNAARLEDVKKEFLAQGRADQEMGGGRWAQTKAEASKAYVKFVDPETRAFLKQTGLDCHPGIVRAFLNVQKAVADDTVVRGQASSGKADPAKAFFYNSNMN